MCQMIIHAHAQSTTMLQALEHNLRTSVHDLDTLQPILAARGALDMTGGTTLAGLDDIEAVRFMVNRAADIVRVMFEVALAEHPHVAGCEHPDHGPDGPTGVTVASSEHIHA